MTNNIKESMNIINKIQKMSHSGAILNIEKDEQLGFVVKKIITDGVDRNFLAIKKQKAFEPLITSCYQVKPIPIHSVQKSEDKLSIKMPYVEGITGEQFAINGNRLSALKLKRTLNAYIIDMWAKSEVREFDISIIVDKVDQIESFTYENDVADSVSSACKYIRSKCTKNWNIPMGLCHGDLTLSNIIVTQDNNMYIFDFLDSFIESPLQDIAKLVQDLKYGWSFRNANPSVRLKGQLFCQAAYPDMIYTIKNTYETELSIIEVLTILRIAPYLSIDDETTRKWFIKVISRFLNEVNI